MSLANDLHNQLVANLVCSIISVNNWSLEKSCDIKDGLRREQVFNLRAVSKMSEQEIFGRLTKAGYVKSDYVKGLISNRLRSLAIYLCAGNIELLAEALEENDTKKSMIFYFV